MGKVTKRDKDALNQLVLDCSIYNFNEEEALGYIKTRFGKQISGRTFRRYKMNLEDGNVSQKWMSYFTRAGFAVTQQQLVECAKKILESSMRRLLQEENKENQDDNLILKLKEEIRKDLELVCNLSFGTPIISNIKTQADNAHSKYNELIKKIRMKNPELLK